MLAVKRPPGSEAADMTARLNHRAALTLIVAGFLLAVAGTGDSAPRCYIVGRYQVVGNNIFDGATGLTWQQAISPHRLTWSDAATYCSTQPGGFRLPTMKELLSIVDYTRASSTTVATINPVAFPNTPAQEFWSSSAEGAFAMVVFFSDGETSPYAQFSMVQVRCVR
jgi:hypothetical protein